MTGVSSYAPTAASSYSPAIAQGTNGRFHEEITKLALVKTPAHKSVYDSLAEVYSIVAVLEMVEKSFLKDYITDKEKYTSTTLRLINQYHMLVKGFSDLEAPKREVLDGLLPGRNTDNSNLLDLIVRNFHIDAPLAVSRLKLGIPATIEHLHTSVEGAHQATNTKTALTAQNSARLVAEATGNFITCMDAVKLNYKTKDQLHPILSELIVSVNELVTKTHEEDGEDDFKPIDFQGKSKLVNWLIRLNNLQNNEELRAEESEQFLADLDMAYKGFYMSL